MCVFITFAVLLVLSWFARTELWKVLFVGAEILRKMTISLFFFGAKVISSTQGLSVFTARRHVGRHGLNIHVHMMWVWSCRPPSAHVLLVM